MNVDEMRAALTLLGWIPIYNATTGTDLIRPEHRYGFVHEGRNELVWKDNTDILYQRAPMEKRLGDVLREKGDRIRAIVWKEVPPRIIVTAYQVLTRP